MLPVGSAQRAMLPYLFNFLINNNNPFFLIFFLFLIYSHYLQFSASTLLFIIIIFIIILVFTINICKLQTYTIYNFKTPTLDTLYTTHIYRPWSGNVLYRFCSSCFNTSFSLNNINMFVYGIVLWVDELRVDGV